MSHNGVCNVRSLIYKFNPIILNPLLALCSGKYVYTELSIAKDEIVRKYASLMQMICF